MTIQNLNHLVEDKIDQNRINLVGIELEGYFDEKPSTQGSFKGDGSLQGFDERNYNDDTDCDGYCRENCECYNECDCEGCVMCDICGTTTQNCQCHECLICAECLEKVENCNCDRNYHKISTCKDPKCNELGVCEKCYNECDEIFNENQELSHDCHECGNVEYECNYDCGCECQCECDCGNDEENGVGEFVSKPLKVSQVEDWIYGSYPTKTNYSCGGHIHISLNSYADYMNLMTYEFYNYYLERIRKWANKMKINEGSQFWKRLEGKQYCHKKFQPELQRDMQGHYDDPRYTHINYCFNVDNRHTLEFRLLPCFQKDYLMVSGVLETISIVEDYLQQLPDNNKVRMRFEL